MLHTKLNTIFFLNSFNSYAKIDSFLFSTNNSFYKKLYYPRRQVINYLANKKPKFSPAEN